jgi:hypothetical protein
VAEALQHAGAVYPVPMRFAEHAYRDASAAHGDGIALDWGVVVRGCERHGGASRWLQVHGVAVGRQGAISQAHHEVVSTGRHAHIPGSNIGRGYSKVNQRPAPSWQYSPALPPPKWLVGLLASLRGLDCYEHVMVYLDHGGSGRLARGSRFKGKSGPQRGDVGRGSRRQLRPRRAQGLTR